MTKYIFIGDIHGKVEVVKEALALDGFKIFTGDFVDSFNRTTSEYGSCLRLVLDAIDAGTCRAVYGNHELSYIFPAQHKCSGNNWSTNQLIRAFGAEIREKFESHIWLENTVLVTHAGLTNQLWNSHGLTFDNLDKTLSEWWDDLFSPMHWVGYARGGRNDYGGTFWCDYNIEFQPVPGLIQVFGHTPGTDIRKIDENYCIDCLDRATKFLGLEINPEMHAVREIQCP